MNPVVYVMKLVWQQVRLLGFSISEEIAKRTFPLDTMQARATRTDAWSSNTSACIAWCATVMLKRKVQLHHAPRFVTFLIVCIMKR